jgi:K+-transporting ATPase c subunit
MATKTKTKKNDPVIHVSPARYAQIERIAKKKGIALKAALELVFKQRLDTIKPRA